MILIIIKNGKPKSVVRLACLGGFMERKIEQKIEK